MIERVRVAIAELPLKLRHVLVLRDVQGRSAEEVRAALGLAAEDERERLHQARARIRGRLERYFEGRTDE